MGRPEEASGALSKHGDDDVPPPPYQESSDATSSQPLHQQVRNTQNANFSAAQPQQQAHINRQFPGKFSMYSQSGGFGTTYYLGEHGSHPLYTVKTHTGFSGSPDVVLHSGPSESSPPLAGVSANTLSRSATVELPPLPGSGGTAAEEPLAFSGFSHGTFTFSIEVGSTGRRESFEWRHSHGNEVDSLGGSSSGWKLVRLATDAPGGQGKGSHFVGGGPQSSDAKEVVAVWSNARMSMSKIFNFQFLGSGVTGALGERWAVMAVITALRIWDKERKARSAAAA